MILPSDSQSYYLKFSLLLHKKDRFYQSNLLAVWLLHPVRIKSLSIRISSVKLRLSCTRFLKFSIKSGHLHGSPLNLKSSLTGRHFDSYSNCSSIDADTTGFLSGRTVSFPSTNLPIKSSMHLFGGIHT